MTPTPDLKLIADMLVAYRKHAACDTDLVHLEASIEEQAELCLAADEDEARRVGTGVASDAVLLLRAYQSHFGAHCPYDKEDSDVWRRIDAAIARLTAESGGWQPIENQGGAK